AAGFDSKSRRKRSILRDTAGKPKLETQVNILIDNDVYILIYFPFMFYYASPGSVVRVIFFPLGGSLLKVE
ncbi:MAG: hypothetical protein PVJ53_06115, partial [Desulfobacterales bacterium]